MPTPMLPGISSGMDQKQIINYLARIHKELQWLLGNLDTLNIRELNADVVNAGTLNANLVRIRSDLTSGYVQWDANGMIINNGVYNTFSVDLNGFVTLAGALIRSRPGTYPMLVMDPTTNLFGAYTDANNYLIMNPIYPGYGAPALNFYINGKSYGAIIANSSLGFYIPSGTGCDIRIHSGQELYLYAMNRVRFQSFDKIMNESTGRTLQVELNGKADGSSISGTVYVAATSGGPATIPITFSNGVRIS
jgi:hypothetical protein